MATTRQLSDYLGSLTQKDTLSTTDKISIVDVDGGDVLKSVSISNLSGSIVVTGSVTATSFVGDGSGLTGITGGGASFPYTGSAIISGSLEVTGSMEVTSVITTQIFLNPQTLTGPLSVPVGYNGILTGPISNAGVITIESNSTLVII